MILLLTKTLKDTKTYQREVSAFGKVIEELGLQDVLYTIVTEDTSKIIEENNLKIIVTNIFEFMKKIDFWTDSSQSALFICKLNPFGCHNKF